MRSIAVLNLKGGVGKTTTVINLAHILSKDYHLRVVVVDCDAQCNLTSFYGVRDEGTTVADVLQGTHEPYWRENLVEVSPTLDILPASSQLYDLDLSAYQAGASRITALRDFVEVMEEDQEVDVVLFDCPPGFTAASTAALMAAREVIIPVLMDGFSLEGMADMLGQISSIRRANPDLKVSGVLITQWHRSVPVIQAERVLRSMPVPVFEQVIRRSDKVLESTMVKSAVADYSATSAAARDYRLLAQEIFGEVPHHGKV